MSENLFRNLPGEFFRLLSQPERAENYARLLYIDDFFGSSSFDVDWDEAILSLGSFIKAKDKSVNRSDSVNEARAFIRKLVQWGWLEKENGEDFSFRLSRSAPFMKMLPVLREIASEHERSDEYYGLSEDIYRSLRDFDLQNPTAHLEQLRQKSERLSRYLLSVNSQMKRFIIEALKDQKRSEREILMTLFDDFESHPSHRALMNLLSKGNPELRHPAIDAAIESFLVPEKISLMADDYLSVKSLERTEENVAEAARFVVSTFEMIRQQFDTIGKFIRQISIRNTSYIQSTKAILEFRLNNFKDILSSVNEALKALRKMPDEETIEVPFNFVSLATLDGQSLYKPRYLGKKAPRTVSFVESERDVESEREMASFLEKGLRFSKSGIASFLKGTIMANGKVAVSELDVPKNADSFISLFLLPSYSLDDYEVSEPFERLIEIGDYFLNDYEIANRSEK